jgi:hypothetical protein
MVGRTLQPYQLPITMLANLASVVVIGLVVNCFRDQLGDGPMLIAFFLLCGLVGPRLLDWFIWPLLGMRIIRKIKADFGPKTQAGVWALYAFGTEPAEQLDVGRIAAQVGESHQHYLERAL